MEEDQKKRGLPRRGTNIEEVETRPFKHKYLLKRPTTHESGSLSRVTSRASVLGLGENGARIDSPVIQKRRFELFIDLIWVGIIGNLAEHFTDQAYNLEGKGQGIGYGTWEFVVLFLLAWRFWKSLQDFMSKYSTNDLLERCFVIWALILAMLYGNNAPYFLSPDSTSNLAGSLYLVFKASLMGMETYYSFHLPHIRRRILLQTILGVPLLALWIPAFYHKYPVKLGLTYAGVALEYWTASIIDTPLAERFLKDDRKEIFDTDHWVERIQDFYIIILGEGVLNLIRGSPLGHGISSQAGAGVAGLLIFYTLSATFFSGDSSLNYIHALRRSWWRKILWLFFHVVMFGFTIVLGVSIAFLIQHPHTKSVKPKGAEGETIDQSQKLEESRLVIAVTKAKWTVAVTLSTVLLCQTAVALLARCLDEPKSLKVTNRYWRLFPRLLVIAVALCLPINPEGTAIWMLGILAPVCMACVSWEWYSSLEKEGGFMEP